MADDPTFQYLKLIIENFSIWPLVIVIGLWWLVRHPELFGNLAEHISKMKVGGFEVELRRLNAKIEETTQQVNELQVEVEGEVDRFRQLVSSFDPHAPVEDLAATREALKVMAGSINDLADIRKGLLPGATPEALYASAEVARARRDVSLFDDLVACLDRLARDDDLLSIRLYTVWTLTSALHRTLIAGIKHAEKPAFSPAQLTAAKKMLAALVQNPRVLADRPDAPMRGIRGPAKWADDWIDTGLAKHALA